VNTAGEIRRERRPDSAPGDAFAHTAEALAKQQIGEWIIGATLAGTHEIGIVAGIGERLNAAGVPVVRVSVATDLLDPMFDGRGVRWVRDEGGVEETFVRDEYGTIVDPDFGRSTFGHLIRSGEPMLRRRLDANASQVFLSNSDDVPEQYRKLVEQYYRSLAKPGGGKQ